MSGEHVDSWDNERALLAVNAALGVRGLHGEIQIMSQTATGVYRVGDVVAKVYRPTETVKQYSRAYGAGKRLGDLGAGVLTPLYDGTLYYHEWGAVGFWPYIEPVREPDWYDVGTLLARLHTLGEPLVGELDLTLWTGNIGTRWATSLYREQPSADIHIADAIDNAGTTIAARCRELTRGALTVIHGDVQLGNVIVGAGGPVLIDLDWLTIGPAEYDCAAIIHALRNDRASSTDVTAFVTGYGNNLLTGKGIETACEVYALSGVVFRLAMACRNKETTAWLKEAARPWL